MKRDVALNRLRELETCLRRQGVSAYYLFGSVARDEADGQSDVDVAFDLPADSAFSLFDQAELQMMLSEELNASVDFVSLGAMRRDFHERLQAEMVRVF
jgi:hypothetical protein